MTMFISHFQAIFAFFTLVLLYGYQKYKNNNLKKKGIMGVPEPSGAWPILGHLPLLDGKDPVFRTLGAMADKYGPIFSLRLGNLRVLVVNNAEMVKECFTTHDRTLATRPNMAAGRYMGYDNAFFPVAPYGPYWRKIRSMVSVELLSTHRLDMIKHVRDLQVKTFIKELHNLCTKNRASSSKVTINNWFENLTFNISLRTLAGKHYSTTEYEKANSEASCLKHTIGKATYLSGVFALCDAIPSLGWIDFQGYVRKMKETAKEMDAILEQWLQEHLARRSKPDQQNQDDDKDFIDAMLSKLEEDTTNLGHDRDTIVKATTAALLLTGSESTAITLTWALSLLLNNSHVLKASQKELDVQIGKNKWVEESDIHNLSYLQAIVKETLRLYPPSPLTGPREAIEDCNIGGHYIPKGTRLIVNIWKLHRDPRVWSDPFEFRPERWLTMHADVDYKGKNFEYIPFSSGRRSCPAMAYAWRVVHLTLARFLQGFHVGTLDGSPVDTSEGLGTAMPKLKPLEVILTPRLPVQLYQFLS